MNTQVWIGCGECDTAFACHEGRACCIREPIENLKTIDMVLHCPACGMQHIDKPEFDSDRRDPYPAFGEDPAMSWTNPPHRSHKCHECGHIWRPADVPTNGVAEVKTKGKNDSPIVKPEDWLKPLREKAWQYDDLCK